MNKLNEGQRLAISILISSEDARCYKTYDSRNGQVDSCGITDGTDMLPLHGQTLGWLERNGYVTCQTCRPNLWCDTYYPTKDVQELATKLSIEPYSKVEC